MGRTATMAEASAWHVRQPTLDEQGWEQFVTWLEASPANARAYDLIALADATIGDLPGIELTRQAANDDAHVDDVEADNVVMLAPHRRWLPVAVGGAMAAALVALVAPLAFTAGPRPYSVETAPGEIRRVALDDGTSITLAGASRVILDRSDARVASLDRGEAMFGVRHDAAKPFVLTVGGAMVTDLGTVFDVARGGSRTDVAVAQGSVRFSQAGANAVLGAGDTLATRADASSFLIGRIAPAAVGGWRIGRLSYSGQPMAVVADALQRRYGTPVRLAGSLPDQPFTGMFRLTGSAERDIPHLAAMIGANARRDGGRWTVSSEATR